jgi:chitin disaccharide deacetylase
MTLRVIFNADDFGQGPGINRGIIECHERGVVGSASLMVTGRAVDEAVALSRDHPRMSVGLHWDVWGEDEREFDISDHGAVRDEFHRQLDEFVRVVGRLPTHVDSHRHAHLEPVVKPLFQELVEPLGLPLRGDGSVRFIGGFYAQWEWRVTNLEYVSVPFLERMLREEVRDEWTEISCHPGYIDPGYTAVYAEEREAEVRTLTDPRIPEVMVELGIELSSYRHYTRWKGSFPTSGRGEEMHKGDAP